MKCSLQIGIILISSLLFFSIVQFSTPHLTEVDGYYHIAYANQIKHDFLMQGFRWWNNSVFTSDINFFYHLLLVPFTFVNLIMGAKLSSVFFASGMVLAFFVLLKSLNIKYIWFYSILLIASSYSFLFRLMQVKAFPLAISFLFVAYMLMEKRKYLYLGILSYIFVLTYSSFPLLFLFAVLYNIVQVIEGRILKKINMADFKLSGSVVAGLLVGMIINPYFPDILHVFYYQIAGHFLFPFLQGVSGNEWLPFPSVITLLFAGGILLLTYTISVFGILKHALWKNRSKLFFLILSTIFLLLTLKSRRFIEYAAPIIIVLFALVTSSIKWNKNLAKTIAACVILLLACTTIFTIKFIGQTVDQKQWYNTASCAGWLENNTKKDSIVFNYWTDFPPLFFYNQHNSYIVGADPVFLQAFDPLLSSKYFSIFSGRAVDPADLIRNDFNANFVFLTLSNKQVVQYFLNADHFRVRNTGKNCLVLEIVDEVGSPLETQNINI